MAYRSPPSKELQPKHEARRKRNKTVAQIQAAQRADQLLEEGDMAGAETWHRILAGSGIHCACYSVENGL